MTSTRIAALGSFVLLVAACRKPPPIVERSAVADAAVPSTMRVVAWGDLQLRLPADSDSHGEPQRFDLSRRAHTPLPDTMTLRRSSSSDEAALLQAAPSKAVLTDGRLAYRVDRAEGGSGGPEATLVGAFEVGGDTYHVECHAQSDDHPPAADWCVPYLLMVEHK